MKKVIVTGANGFIGSAVVGRLLQEGIEVIALVHSRQRRCFASNPRLRVVPFALEQIGELDTLIPDRDIDTFYHFAWDGGHAEERNDAGKQLKNAEWSVECVRAAKRLGCGRVVCAGTIMEFETYATAMAQENRPGMGYIYGGAKLAAHAMCKSAAVQAGIDLVWGMLINAYGVGEHAPRLINRTIRDILAGRELKFTAGTQIYDFVYVDDAAEAFYLLGERGVAFKSYMIGSGRPRPLKAFLEELRETIAPEQTFHYGAIPYTGIDLPESVFFTEALSRDTGYVPRVSFRDGVKRTRDWLAGTRE